MRFILGLSIALNLFLLTTIVAARVDPMRSSLAVQQGSDQILGNAESLIEPNAIETVRDLVAVLQPTGLGADGIKRLVVGWLSEKYRGSYRPDGPGYWHQDYSPRSHDLATRMGIDEQVRGDLIAYFGNDAASDSSFDSAFRPLGPAYAFLDSEAQLKLQRRQLDMPAMRNPARESQAPQMARCPPMDLAPDSRPATSNTAVDLSPSADREYRLRFSPTSQQLRDSAVADDEQEFRVLFDRMSQLEQDASPAAQAQIRAELRVAMGDQAFDRLWSIRDPFYESIESYLVAEGFAAYQVQEAYSVVNRSQEALLRSMGPSPNQESALNAVRQIKEDEAARLSRLLGDQAAAGMTAAMSRVAMEMSHRTGRMTQCEFMD